ncbi:PIN domain-containing protein [Streptacidiphilus sp. EB103A]|uniref:PIN domain-containing protein n=1 Tax=Streptacidiphilus sp. EB103A TaxID=3156275 RepID=UPI003515A02B
MIQALMLDSEGLSQAVRRTREVQNWVQAAWAEDIPVVTSAAILVEIVHAKIDRSALRWTLSKITVEPVTEAVAGTASDLLLGAGLHGHKYAIDAILAATALARPGNIALLTSDVDDMTQLLGKHPRIQLRRL